MWPSTRLPGPSPRIWARAGVLGTSVFVLESAVARVCREAGARVTTNVFVRDLDLGAPEARGGPRLEVVADGLPPFGVACHHLEWLRLLLTPRWCQRCTVTEVPLAVPRIEMGLHWPLPDAARSAALWSRCRLGVMANEVGGEMVVVGSIGLRQLAKAWKLRWLAILSCAAAASSLLELRGHGGADGVVPLSHEVETSVGLRDLSGAGWIVHNDHVLKKTTTPTEPNRTQPHPNFDEAPSSTGKFVAIKPGTEQLTAPWSSRN